MKLTDKQYCRAFAFVELLKLTVRGVVVPTDEKEEIQLPHLNERAIMALQDGTESNASHFADQNFPHVSFDDDTVREAVPFVESEELSGEADEVEPTEAELAEIRELAAV